MAKDDVQDASLSTRSLAEPTGLQGVARALRVLGLFLEQEELGARAVAAKLDLNPAVAHRLLATLTEAQFVVQDRVSRAYRLGPRVGALGEAYARAEPFQRAIRDALTDLSRLTGETAAVHVLRAGRRICLQQSESSHRLRYSMVLHTPMPVTNGATDQVMRAFGTPDEVADIRTVLESAAEYGLDSALMGLDSADSLLDDYHELGEDDLIEVRRRGWASGMGLREAGVGSVAAPLRRDELFVITVFGPEHRIGEAGVERLGDQLLDVVERIRGS